MPLLDLLTSLFSYSDFEKKILETHPEPSLIVKHTQRRQFTVDGVSLTLRVLHVPHYRAHKLPPLPLILCIHGLGGQLAQFHPIIDNLSHFAEIVAVDLPGHGKSELSYNWSPDYTPEFLTKLLTAVLTATSSEPGREVVLIGHSLGCSLAVRLAKTLGIRCLGVIAIAPPLPLTEAQKKQQSRLGWTPAWLFNIFRAVDKQGGLYSASVSRMFSPNNKNEELRAQQLCWNIEVQTAGWLRTAYYAAPTTEDEWRKVDCPVLLIGAEFDQVVSTDSVNQIVKWLGPKSSQYMQDNQNQVASPDGYQIDSLPKQTTSNPLILKNQQAAAAAASAKAVEEDSKGSIEEAATAASSESNDSPSEASSFSPPSPQIEPSLRELNASDEDAIKVIEPKIVHDTGHQCLIEKPEVISGLISVFIAHHVDVKLSLGWQLAFLASKKDKWSLKNENKWRNVESVSDIIEGTPFRGMKTLRQDDGEHSPPLFEEKYPDITDIIDISRETPPYDPSTFSRIVYHKFPTVSKLPPSKKEVSKYIQLVDSIREKNPNAVIGTHCHYGFNRTGFFLCCYMIERLGFTIKKALIAFKNARNPGIKHTHFIDELYVRYEL